MLSTFQAGLVVKHGTLNSALVRKDVGDQATPPSSFGYSGMQTLGADFSTLETALKGAEIDAHSTGNGAFPPVNPNKRLALPNAWLTLTVSVSNAPSNPPVIPAGSHFGIGNSGAELATYYFPDSVGIDEKLVGSTVLETSRSHLGLGQQPNDDVTALDYGLGFVAEDPGRTEFFHYADQYFFSVTKEWADANSTANFYHLNDRDAAPNLPPHAADIYRIVHENNVWKTPTLYMSWQELGFHDHSGDLDGLEVNWPVNRVLYSGVRGTLNPLNTDLGSLSQIMYYERGLVLPGGTSPLKPIPVVDADGRDVVGELGIEAVNGHEIDSLCGLDPEIASNVTVRDFGLAARHLGPFGPPMGMSIARTSKGLNLDATLVVQVTGWGGITPVGTRLRLYQKKGATTVGGSSGPWQVVRTAFRSATDDSVEFFFNGLGPSTNRADSFLAMLVDDGGRPLVLSLISDVDL